jgi:hypothetical protein
MESRTPGKGIVWKEEKQQKDGCKNYHGFRIVNAAWNVKG